MPLKYRSYRRMSFLWREAKYRQEGNGNYRRSHSMLPDGSLESHFPKSLNKFRFFPVCDRKANRPDYRVSLFVSRIGRNHHVSTVFNQFNLPPAAVSLAASILWLKLTAS